MMARRAQKGEIGLVGTGKLQCAQGTAYRTPSVSVDIRVIGLIDVVDSIRRDESGDIEFHASLIDYAAIWINGEAAASSDASDVSWYDLADLPGLKLWTETERIILKSAKILKDYAEKSA